MEDTAITAPVINIRERSAGKKFAEIILTIFFPPLAVWIHDDLDCNRHTAINILLCILGFWICGIIHSVWYCFMRD